MLNLPLTEREVELLENTLTTLSILRPLSPIDDPYKDDYGRLLGKLLNVKEDSKRKGCAR